MEEDRHAISALLDDYAFGIDTRDWGLVRSVFTFDAVLDYTAFGGPKGDVDEVVSWIARSVEPFAMTQHHITNRRIAIHGDRATVTSELFAPMGMTAGEGRMHLLLTGGRYEDALRRTVGGWRIASRVCRNAWLGAPPEVSGPGAPS